MADEPEPEHPSIPPAPPEIGSFPPLPPRAHLIPPAPPPAPPEPPLSRDFYDKKLSDLEKRLQEEREKLLLANLKSQQEAATSARVEVSIKELQDKLRRDRRDQEHEESRLKLEARLQELEARLAQERETWVSTLRGQMQTRETQDKEIETHFALRLQEMERRWLEEKAQWQKAALAKDEEIRNLRALSEKLRGSEVDLSKALSEKKWLEARLAELSEERAQSQARVQAAVEREKEAAGLKAELMIAKQEARGLQEKLEREVSALRLASREREERLLSDQERLQRELATLAERLKAEHESELRRVKLEAEADQRRYREALERAQGDLQRLRAVAGALERQVAAGRVQISEFQAAKAEWERLQERTKAEFVVLQRKWIEREREIRAEVQAQGLQMLEAEKAKIRVLAQDEINQRAAKIAEQLERERDGELKRREGLLRSELEREVSGRLDKLRDEWDAARKKLESDVEAARREGFQKEDEVSKRLRAKEAELHGQALRAEEASGRAAREEETRQAAERAKLELEKGLQGLREELGAFRAKAADLEAALAKGDQERQALSEAKAELERLAAAQAAQVSHTQEALEQLRGQIAREGHLSNLYLGQKEDLEKSIGAKEQTFRRELEGRLEAQSLRTRELEGELAIQKAKAEELSARLRDVKEHSLTEHFFRKPPPSP